MGQVNLDSRVLSLSDVNLNMRMNFDREIISNVV